MCKKEGICDQFIHSVHACYQSVSRGKIKIPKIGELSFGTKNTKIMGSNRNTMIAYYIISV